MTERLSRRNLQYLLVALFVVVNIFIWAAVFHADRRGELRVAFLDVGQGDAILIEAPNGNQLLIDGGPSGGALLRSLGREMSFWDRTIDVVLATHADQDHVGGLPSVLQSMNIANVVTTENISNTGTYTAFKNAIIENGVHHLDARVPGRIILDDGVVFEILFPNSNTTDWETNTASIVGRLSYGNTSFLLTGDSPQSVEKYLVGAHGGKIHANVLKLGHHGSKTSSSEVFLSAVSPEYAIVSAGNNNKYGHPNKEVIDLLSKFGIPIINTANTGTILFVTDGTELKMVPH